MPDRADLAATPCLDADHPEVRAFARRTAGGPAGAREQAVALYYAVRDGIRYDAHHVDLRAEAMRASTVLARGSGFCVSKAVLLAAAARALGIPARLGFADVRNHLTTERMRRMMGTDLFVFHGYTSLWLDGRWVKATPAFDRALCERFDVEPLDFDGRRDSLFQQTNRRGRRYMEYVRERGEYADLPLEEMRRVLAEAYPALAAAGEDGNEEEP